LRVPASSSVAGPFAAQPQLAFVSQSFFFSPGDNAVRPSDLAVLSELVRLSAKPGSRTFVTGMTDSSGSPVANALLAHRRADAVSAALRNLGHTGVRLSSQADFTATRPPPPQLYRSTLVAGSARFRRVDVVIAIPQADAPRIHAASAPTPSS